MDVLGVLFASSLFLPLNNMLLVRAWMVASGGTLRWGCRHVHTPQHGLRWALGVDLCALLLLLPPPCLAWLRLVWASIYTHTLSTLQVMPVVAADRAVYYREKASGMYGGAVFAAAQAIAELPFLFMQSVLFVVIVYTTVHFEFNSAKAMWFWLYMWLQTMFFTFFGIASSE